MKTIATLFTGFGGVEVGAIQAGLRPIWGVEYDPKIAAVANKNLGEHVIVADVCHIDPATLERPDVLHASPVCKNASVASRGEETEEDRQTATAVTRFIDALKPAVFTLENVYPYRHFKSFKIITDCLSKNGYMWDYENVNAADFGVPQTRRRLILRAVYGRLLPQLPPPAPWVGWYEAIADLIPTLPDSKFAQWQLDRLPREMKSFVMNEGNPNGNGKRKYRLESEPLKTITAGGMQTRAFISDCQQAGEDIDGYRGVTVKQITDPVFTVTGSQSKRPMRGFVVSGERSESKNGMTIVIRDQDKPTVTVRASNNGGLSPSFANGRVVQMTPRALARFQSFPDWYKLPENKTLACKGIGNAVPPLLYEKIIRQFI